MKHLGRYVNFFILDSNKTIQLENRLPMKTMSIAKISKVAAGIFVVGSIFSTIETIWFNDYW